MVIQPTLGKFVCTFETKAWLIKEGFAIIYKTHLELLFKMADSAGIQRPVVVDETLGTSMVEEGQQVKTRTACLPCDEAVTVYMSVTLLPPQFQFVETLSRLERDITSWV